MIPIGIDYRYFLNALKTQQPFCLITSNWLKTWKYKEVKMDKMKILYLVNMKPKRAGGLFKATYERIVRHNKQAKIYIENINFYDNSTITFIKTYLFNNRYSLKQASLKYNYELLEINNFNFARGIKYHFSEKIQFEKNNLDSMADAFIKKNKQEISEADVIHAHWGYPNGYLAYRAAQKYDKPYFITFHGSDLNSTKKKEVPYLLESMEYAETCFFVSKQLLKNAIDLGYSGSNTAITYNGVDLEDFKIPCKSLQENKKVGYIGSLEPVKGADLLPEIFEEIAKRTDERIDFTIVGDGSLKNTIETTVEASNLPVEFTGQVDFEEIPKILEGVDVLVVPSRNEGLGMVILEANAMGIPAVGMNVGGIPEAIGYKENLIEPTEDRIENMAQRVSTILENDREDPNKYRNRVKENFLWEDIVEIERKHYLNALEKRNK